MIHREFAGNRYSTPVQTRSGDQGIPVVGRGSNHSQMSAADPFIKISLPLDHPPVSEPSSGKKLNDVVEVEG